MAMLLALFFWVLATITVVLFAGRVWWPPEGISVHAAALDGQMVITLVVAGVAFFLAQIGLGYYIWRFRARGNERATYWHESPKLEMTWTLITAVVFVGLGIRGNKVW